MNTKIRQVLYQAIYESGEVLLRHFGKVKNIEFKSTEFDIVTEAELWSNFEGKMPDGKILVKDRIADQMFQQVDASFYIYQTFQQPQCPNVPLCGIF